ncbi:MAG: Uma2 family endonuclease [Cyanobacteriota bacterium]|nr:Uma2 family endonuclease [Cyanobacteriota bacterium]
MTLATEPRAPSAVLPVNAPAPEIIYPSSDGEPLAETQQHVLAILTTLALLRLYLQDRPAVVFADQFFYYVKDKPRARVAPDVMVIFDIPKRLYANYKLWEGKQTPAIIFEVTSAGTKEVDWGFKKALYEQLGVLEYWLFDPYGDWISGQLQGYRLNPSGVYEPIADHQSQVLGLQLRPEEYLMGFYRLDTGEKLLTPEELYEAAQTANQRAELSEQLAQQAQRRAELSEERAERLAAKLRELGAEIED